MPSKWRSKPTCNMALAGRRRGTLTGQKRAKDETRSLPRSGPSPTEVVSRFAYA